MRTAASLSLTSWSESGPWCGGSRMTSPSSTLDYCDIHRDQRLQSPSNKSDPDAQDRQLGESSATTGVCNVGACVCVCSSPASHTHELESAAAGRILGVQPSFRESSDRQKCNKK